MTSHILVCLMAIFLISAGEKNNAKGGENTEDNFGDILEQLIKIVKYSVKIIHIVSVPITILLRIQRKDILENKDQLLEWKDEIIENVKKQYYEKSKQLQKVVNRVSEMKRENEDLKKNLLLKEMLEKAGLSPTVYIIPEVPLCDPTPTLIDDDIQVGASIEPANNQNVADETTGFIGKIYNSTLFKRKENGGSEEEREQLLEGTNRTMPAGRTSIGNQKSTNYNNSTITTADETITTPGQNVNDDVFNFSSSGATLNRKSENCNGIENQREAQLSGEQCSMSNVVDDNIQPKAIIQLNNIQNIHDETSKLIVQKLDNMVVGTSRSTVVSKVTDPEIITIPGTSNQFLQLNSCQNKPDGTNGLLGQKRDDEADYSSTGSLLNRNSECEAFGKDVRPACTIISMTEESQRSDSVIPPGNNQNPRSICEIV